MPSSRRWSGVAGAVFLSISSLLAPLATTSTLAHAADGHPARIQHGSCDSLTGVAFQLTGVGATITADGTPVPPPVTVGATVANPLQTSETTLQASLTQLTQDPHAIVVYESDEAMDRIIACGDIGGVLIAQMPGMIMPGDVLPIWLSGAEGSEFAGMATLQADGTQAIVRLYLTAGDSTYGAHGAPAESELDATPPSG